MLCTNRIGTRGGGRGEGGEEESKMNRKGKISFEALKSIFWAYSKLKRRNLAWSRMRLLLTLNKMFSFSLEYREKQF